MLRDARSLVSGVSRVLRGEETGIKHEDPLQKGVSSQNERTDARDDMLRYVPLEMCIRSYKIALKRKNSFLRRFPRLAFFDLITHEGLQELISKYQCACEIVEDRKKRVILKGGEAAIENKDPIREERINVKEYRESTEWHGSTLEHLEGMNAALRRKNALLEEFQGLFRGNVTHEALQELIFEYQLACEILEDREKQFDSIGW